MSQEKFSLPIATALRQSIGGYSVATFRHDAIAGLIVSLLALPLAMALAIAVGLPPQHGIYTAIVAGIAAAIFGGSATQVSGPTAAFVVIVAPIVAKHGLNGLIWCEIMAGIMLIVMGSAKLGKYINYIPYPVTTGFTTGIAVVIATLSLNDFFGLRLGQLHGEYIDKVATLVRNLPSINLYEFAIGMVTLLLIFFFGRITRAIPSTVVGITTGTLIAYLLSQYGIDIATIGSNFSYETSEGMKHGIPPYPPNFDILDIPTYAQFKTLLVPAMVIAALAALESLLAATVADSMSGKKHNPNAELNGIGIANILSGLAAGIPATGAIARTAANIHSGAKTPIASIIHALLIMLYVILLSPLINHIPMSSLSAILLVTAYRMSHMKQFIRTIKIAPSSDSIVLLTCFGLTVFIDMVAGVVVGVVLASLLFMKRISDLTEFNFTSANGNGVDKNNIALPDNVMVYRINGPLFFGTVEKAFDRYRFVHDHVDTLVIDMENVPLIDMTGLVAMKSMLTGIAREGREVILCGKKDVTHRILKKISDQPIRLHIKTVTTVEEAVNMIKSKAA